MSAKFLYLYAILGTIFIVLGTISFIRTQNTYTSILDVIVGIFALYRAYRIYKTKQDSELM